MSFHSWNTVASLQRLEYVSQFSGAVIRNTNDGYSDDERPNFTIEVPILQSAGGQHKCLPEIIKWCESQKLHPSYELSNAVLPVFAHPPKNSSN